MDLNRHLFPAAITFVFAIFLSGCALSPNLTSNLENDEIYLNKDEEFVSDALVSLVHTESAAGGEP